MSAKIQTNVALAPFTTFGVGGNAEKFVQPENSEELIEILENHHGQKIWLLGYGSNVLISDKGLPGLTIMLRSNNIEVKDKAIIADSGVWWDDIVKEAVSNGLWGIELLSEVPGSLGAALYINIAAYGQSIGPVVEWVDIWDADKHEILRLGREVMSWDYKKSIFQNRDMENTLILRASLSLSGEKTTEITYQKATDIATELGLDTESLSGRRQTIIEARRRAGSLWNPDDNSSRTAGSFFRNPLVSAQQVNKIVAHDESGLAAEVIKKMNQAHGGHSHRVSAAHVMLAAGFTRGQLVAKHVRLHEKNLLKLETLPGAKATEVYEAMKIIQNEVNEKLGIILEPEVKLLGDF